MLILYKTTPISTVKPYAFAQHLQYSDMMQSIAISFLLISSTFACLPGLGGAPGGCGAPASPCAAPPAAPPMAPCGGGCGASVYPAGPMASPYLAPPPPPPPAAAPAGQPVYSAPLPSGNSYVAGSQGK